MGLYPYLKLVRAHFLCVSFTSPTYPCHQRSQGDTFQELLAPTVGVEVTDASREGQSKKDWIDHIIQKEGPIFNDGKRLPRYTYVY